jgi:3-isopropylmalate/(R)-2-methylmalate dehydratase small subunit
MSAPKVARFESGLIPLPAENVDTDQIVPARYLKVIDKAGLAEALFHDWRFDATGAKRVPPFVIDDPRYVGRAILVAGDNFGTGSSREHAPWALAACGIQAIISTSFADIFKSNALKNGILPIVLSADVHATFMSAARDRLDARVTIDLASATLSIDGGAPIPFPVDAFNQKMLLEGLDELEYVRTNIDAILAHEAAHATTINTRAPRAS